MGKAIVSWVCMIVMMGVFAGVVVAAGENGKDESSQKNAVSNICSVTDNIESCEKTLQSVNSSNPNEFISKSILAAQASFKKFFNFSEPLIVKAGDKPRTRSQMALNDCQELIDYAVDSLQASYSHVEDGEANSLNDRVDDLRTWLSAVISYQESCKDSFDKNDKMKTQVSDNMVDAKTLTANALAIVTKLSDVFTKLGLKLTAPNSGNRKLFSVNKSNGYPTWFSAADRKLLAKIDNGKLKPNAVVAKDGSGKFKTIAAALEAAPKESKTRYVIYVKAGVYDEYITVDKKTTNILMYGDGPRKTIVTGHKNFIDGTSTWKTATFSAIGAGFICRSMGFQNTAGPEKHQAVALRVQSDKSVFFNCRMDGYQDTLYNHANRQYFRNCVISGTVDFIFGDSPTFIQNSLLIVRKPLDNQKCLVTAQGKTVANENSGTVIHNCRIVPEQKLFKDRFKIKTYLGRPWKEFSTAVFMESTLSDFIQPEGFLPWQENLYLDTLYYAEYNNRGRGANTAKRVNWKGYKNIDRNTAMKFTIKEFLLKDEDWLTPTGIPFIPGLRS